MDLNKTTRTLCAILGICAFLAVFCWASKKDYEETILYSMPQAAYEQIYVELGSGCKDKEIVEKYMSNKKYYDSLCLPYQDQ